MTLGKSTGKKKCKCGRPMIVARTKEGTLNVPVPVCGSCKSYGLEESKRLFVQEDAMLRKKGKTEFNITKGKLHVNAWKKR